jgi:peptide/nickel transport system ATP-binding protein
MNGPLIRIDNLTIAFGDNAVVQDVSFEIADSRTVALVGESGSGKSITAAAIMGLLPKNARVTSGQVRHLPSQSTWVAPGQSPCSPLGKGLSMVFQDPMSSLNPSMRVGWQVAESLIVHQRMNKTAAKAEAIQLLDEVELPEPSALFERYPHELSGGQKQRVMIALALAAKPDLLIADEPTTALDVTVQKAVLLLLNQLKVRRKLAILFITHDLDVVRDIADSVLVMQHGKLVEQGIVGTLMNQPKHPYTQALIAAKSIPKRSIGTKIGAPLVVASNVTKTYSQKKNLWGKPVKLFKAVDDVSLTLLEGERVGLIGESGSGKSTLGRALIGLTAMTSGLVSIDSVPVEHNRTSSMQQIRRDAQLVFQDPYSALNPKIPVGKAISEVYEHLGMDAKNATIKAVQLIQEVGLNAEDAQRYPGNFSGGQRQRLVIARALAVEPRFVVLDESVAALDVQIQRDILDLLAKIGDERNLTFLFISHDISVIASFCNRLLIMHKGRIVEQGDTHDILEHPKDPYTRELLASRPGKIPLTTA